MSLKMLMGQNVIPLVLFLSRELLVQRVGECLSAKWMSQVGWEKVTYLFFFFSLRVGTYSMSRLLFCLSLGLALRCPQ